MLEAMDSRLFVEWMAFSELEPFGSFAENYHYAAIASLIANGLLRNAKEHPEPYRPEDFYSGIQTKSTEPSREEKLQQLKRLFQELKD